MASISKIKSKKGPTKWRVRFRRKGVPHFCKFFKKKFDALEWAKANEEFYMYDPSLYILNKKMKYVL